MEKSSTLKRKYNNIPQDVNLTITIENDNYKKLKAENNKLEIAIKNIQTRHDVQITGLNNKVNELINLINNQNTKYNELENITKNKQIEQDGQISGLKNKIADLNKLINNLNTKYNELEIITKNKQIEQDGQISDLENKIIKLNKLINTQNTKIDDLEKRISFNEQIVIYPSVLNHIGPNLDYKISKFVIPDASNSIPKTKNLIITKYFNNCNTLLNKLQQIMNYIHYDDFNDTLNYLSFTRTPLIQDICSKDKLLYIIDNTENDEPHKSKIKKMIDLIYDDLKLPN